MAFVAIKMGRRSGSCRTRGGRISEWIRNRSGSCRTAAGPFSSQPSGPWPVGCFSALLTPHVSIQICSSLVPVRLAPPWKTANWSGHCRTKAILFMGQDT